MPPSESLLRTSCFCQSFSLTTSYLRVLFCFLTALILLIVFPALNFLFMNIFFSLLHASSYSLLISPLWKSPAVPLLSYWLLCLSLLLPTCSLLPLCETSWLNSFLYSFLPDIWCVCVSAYVIRDNVPVTSGRLAFIQGKKIFGSP